MRGRMEPRQKEKDLAAYLWQELSLGILRAAYVARAIVPPMLALALVLALARVQ